MSKRKLLGITYLCSNDTCLGHLTCHIIILRSHQLAFVVRVSLYTNIQLLISRALDKNVPSPVTTSLITVPPHHLPPSSLVGVVVGWGCYFFVSHVYMWYKQTTTLLEVKSRLKTRACGSHKTMWHGPCAATGPGYISEPFLTVFVPSSSK